METCLGLEDLPIGSGGYDILHPSRRCISLAAVLECIDTRPQCKKSTLKNMLCGVLRQIIVLNLKVGGRGALHHARDAATQTGGVQASR
ncbi:hypothetical protein U9M48_023385 [Paspalum notatum var. saurae]|uniref:RNA-directed RNA polymerase n=1 Tax=Paspalum notatum var. saurae TaxID=547442 RepID=A0AAQ3TKK3_PASNO